MYGALCARRLSDNPVAAFVARDALLAALPDDVGRRLRIYADLLVRWQPTINLVAPSTLPDLWSRHIADSLQTQAAVPNARRWVDLGSGGGFPGLVTAIALADRPEASVQLVESDKRKCAFLRTVSRETGACATIHAVRIEAFVPLHGDPVDAVSARRARSLAAADHVCRKIPAARGCRCFSQGTTCQCRIDRLSA